MKRVGVAAVLVALVIVLCVGELWLQQRATDRLLIACDEMVLLYESGDSEQCTQAARQFPKELEKAMRWFPFFLRHERMETVFQQASTLPYLVNDNDPADFMSAISSIRMQLEILLDNEWPTLENIL